MILLIFFLLTIDQITFLKLKKRERKKDLMNDPD